MAEPKERNVVVAGLLTILAGGVGFLYLGRWRWAIANSIALPLILALGAWTKLVHVPLGLVVTAFTLLTVWIGATVLAVRFARRQEPMPLKRYQRWYVYVGFYLVVSILGNVLVENRGYLLGYDTFRVPSGSMKDTLLPGDYFLSNSWEFRNRAPKRGEVIVFLFPRDSSLKYVQRVIGLPGDTVQVRGGKVQINGIALEEPYVKLENSEGRAVGNGEFRVPAGEYFVLGDNRDNSYDSRFWGMVPAANLYGSAEYLWMSYGAGGLRFERIGKWIR